MFWTVIGDGFVRVFYGPKSGAEALKEALELFKGSTVIAVVAGHHITSTYLRS
jgi:hypothetical protein